MNVLLSSVGRRSYLVEYFKKALGDRGKVISTNTFPEATGMWAADHSEIVPPAKSPRFIDSLIGICRKHDVKLLCSLHDWEAPYIASERDRFRAEGVTLVLPSQDIIDLCLDKFSTWEFAQEHGIRAPATFLALADAENALEAGGISFPLIVKPRFGQGSINLIQVNCADELRWGFSIVESQLARMDLGRFMNGEGASQVLIQECIAGREYGVDIINDLNGDFAAVFVKRKFAMRSGETDGAETVECPAIDKIARQIARITRHPGILDADFFMDESGNVWLLEMNPRFGGGYPFSHAAGADLPKALVVWAEGGIPDRSSLCVKTGVKALKEIGIRILEE